MHALLTPRLRILLLVAVWQLFLPLQAYAHMSKTGALTQEVCTSMGMRTVVLEAGTDVHSNTPDTSSTASATHSHDCCVFNLSALSSAGFEGPGVLIQPNTHIEPMVSWPPAFVALGLHAPPTGPPLK